MLTSNKEFFRHPSLLLNQATKQWLCSNEEIFPSYER